MPHWRSPRLESIIRFVTRVLIAAYLVEAGLLLLVAPWTSLWDRNYLFLMWPAVRPVLSTTIVRAGIASTGLLTMAGGALDLYALFSRPSGRAAPSADAPPPV